MTTDMSSLTERMRALLAPLGAEEERRAIDAALAAEDSSRGRLLVRGAELMIHKAPRRGETPERRVRVLLSGAAESSVHEVLVDAQGKVVAQRSLGPRNSPYLEDEIAGARAVAERDERVLPRLVGYKIAVGTFAPRLAAATPAANHRLVGLHFLDVSNPATPKPLTSVVVDLATRQLVDDGHRGQHGPHGHEPQEA